MKSLDKKKPVEDKLKENHSTDKTNNLSSDVRNKVVKPNKPKELDFNDKLYDIWFESLCNGNYQMFQKKVKELFTQQRTELLEEIKTRVDTWGGFEDDGGNLCHYDSEILEWVKNLLNKK